MKQLVKKSNPLREFFIGLSVQGAKESVKDIDKVTKSEKKLEDQVDETTDAIEEQDNAFRALGRGIRQGSPAIERGMKKISDVTNDFRALSSGNFGSRIAAGAKVATTALSGFLGVLKGIFGYISQTVAVLGGILGAQLVNFVGSTTANLAALGVRDASAEEYALVQFQRALTVQGKYTQKLDQSMRDLAAILQDRLGVSADDIITGAARFAATGVDPSLINRSASAAARLSDRSGKPMSLFFEQLNKAFNLGIVEETLASEVPQLKILMQEDREAVKTTKTLDIIEKALGPLVQGEPRTLSRLTDIMKVRFSEFMKQFGRPVRDSLKGFVSDISRQLQIMTNTGWGFTAVADIAVRFLNSLRRLTTTGLNSFAFVGIIDERMSQILKTIGQITIDFTKFFIDPKGVVEQSLIGKYVEAAGYERSISGLLKYLTVEFFKVMIDAFLKALKEVIGLGTGFDDSSKQNRSVLEKVLGKENLKKLDMYDKKGGILKDVINYLTPDSIKGTLFDPWNLINLEEPKTRNERLREERLKENKKSNSQPNPNDQGSIRINQDIKISTNQPASVIENSLAAGLMQVSNMGRVV